MIDTDPTDPGMNRHGARQFFHVSFYADYLTDMESVAEAVEDYLAINLDDPYGELLLADVEELLDSGLSEEQLTDLIEGTWHADASAQFFEFKYTDVLKQIAAMLHDLKHRDNYQAAKKQ